MRTFIFLLLPIMLFSSFGFSSEEVLVKEAAPFKVSLPFAIPKGAIHPLNTYLDLLIATRPLPMDYLLESHSYDEKRGVLNLSGRFMRGGKHTLFLGTFVWGKTVMALPSIEVTVTPLQKIFISGRDILLPFPEFSLQETVENVTLKKYFAQESLLQAAKVLAGQRRFRDGLAGILFLLVVSPALYFLIERKIEGWKIARHIITPKEELKQVRKSRDWTRLLALLQRLSGRQESLTSYELAAIFSREKNSYLEKASLLIERHGYLQESDPRQFDEAIKQVKDFVGSMPS